VADGPEDYIEIASRLVRDDSFALEVRAEIQETKAKIFEGTDTVQEHVKFFEKATYGEV